MNIIFQSAFVLIISLLSAGSFADRVLNTYYYRNLAISNANTYDQHESKANYSKKILIQKIAIKPYGLTNKKVKQAPLPTPEPGSVIWEITPDQLPVSSRTCIDAGIDTCEYAHQSHTTGCYNSCVLYGPEFLAHDEKRGKIYFLAGTANVGTGGGPFLGFVGDIKTKKIKYLNVFYGFVTGELSPSGTYLLLIGSNYITIYNTLTGDTSTIQETTDWNQNQQRLHHMRAIHWLSDTQFSYQDGIRHSKFQRSFDAMNENIYDIPRKKIIHTRVMAHYEI
jgi:hypothetical protein